MNPQTPLAALDLTKRPPRSPHCRLGGYVLLPRMLDKGRATIAGTNGEFHYDCPLDQHIINFLGIDPAVLKEELATGKGDGEILEWVAANSKHKRFPWEIQQWSDYIAKRGPDSDAETMVFFTNRIGEYSKTREDIKSFFELLDVDDYATFGGKA